MPPTGDYRFPEVIVLRAPPGTVATINAIAEHLGSTRSQLLRTAVMQLVRDNPVPAPRSRKQLEAA